MNKCNRASAIKTASEYMSLYNFSISDPVGFWGEHGGRLDWFKMYTTVKNTSFAPNNVRIKWYEDGELNACYNCVDRHIVENGDRVAVVYRGEDDADRAVVTYRELHDMVCRFSNLLRRLGVGKGDVVAIYMPMCVEAVVAMLSCARIGAVHTVIFAGFACDAIAMRLTDCGPKIVVTTDGFRYGGKVKPLKSVVDEALRKSHAHCTAKNVIVVRSGLQCDHEWVDGRDISYHEAVASESNHCDCEVMNAEDPLFILYTSGSTGAPKGIVHSTGGYLVFASMTHEYVFDYRCGEVFWCAADIGWITGHSYVVYGPLANGATTVISSGGMGIPDFGRYWRIIDECSVNAFYTAPTVVRSLRSHSQEYMQYNDRSSLRVIGTVGELIDAELWTWLHDVVGQGKCYVTNTWWQTETGGHLIAPVARYNIALKTNSVALPFLGISPVLINDVGECVEGSGVGALCFADSWPGQARTMYKNHALFEETYFRKVPGVYFSGDGARRDDSGYYWITGRVDDVINVSGRRLSTSELEGALLRHSKILDAAVVGYSHSVKGTGIYAYVVLHDTIEESDALKKEINDHVRETIGHFAYLDCIQCVASLPKTRSGKIVRHILRAIADGKVDDLGDMSTLTEPGVVSALIRKHHTTN